MRTSGGLELLEGRINPLLGLDPGEGDFRWNSHVVRKYVRPNRLNLLLPVVGLLAYGCVAILCVREAVLLTAVRGTWVLVLAIVLIVLVLMLSAVAVVSTVIRAG